MAPHSSTLAWKIPWVAEPGRLPDTAERIPIHFSLSCIGEGNGNPLQCSCLENPRDGGAWLASIYGIAESERTVVKAWSWGNAFLNELMIKWIQKYLKHLCIWMLVWAILCFQWDQEWVLVQQEGGRFEMRMYWFGEKTVSPAVRGPPRQILTRWKKEIVFPFRIKLFCGTFPVLPWSPKGQRVSGPWNVSLKVESKFWSNWPWG